MIENFQEITDYIEKNKDTEEVSNFINGLKTPITRDAVEQWMSNGEGRSYRDSICDIYSAKAVETARENAIKKYEAEVLPKKLEEYKKSISNEGKTPEQIQLEQVMAELEAMKKEKALADKKDSIGKELVTNGLPMELLGFLNWEAEDSIIKEQAKTINDLISKAVSEGIKAELTKNNPQPRKSEGNGEEDEFTLAMRKLHGDLF